MSRFGVYTVMLVGLVSAFDATSDGPGPCDRELLAQVGNHSVWRRRGERAFFFEAGLAIDADGAPSAYSPDGRGLDHLGNAGGPGHWWGLVTADGKPGSAPVLQGPADPFPGFYVSPTALVDPAWPERDPRRYVDSSSIPYLALPPKVLGGARGGAALGDVAAVVNRRTGAVAYAVVADVGPKEKLGEGSIALANALGLPSSPKSGGAEGGLTFVVFPATGRGRPLDRSEIEREGARALAEWGGAERLIRCGQ